MITAKIMPSELLQGAILIHNGAYKPSTLYLPATHSGAAFPALLEHFRYKITKSTGVADSSIVLGTTSLEWVYDPVREQMVEYAGLRLAPRERDQVVEAIQNGSDETHKDFEHGIHGAAIIKGGAESDAELLAKRLAKNLPPESQLACDNTHGARAWVSRYDARWNNMPSCERGR